MKQFLSLAMACIFLLSACSSSKKNTGMSMSSSYPSATPRSTDDGLSYANAIVITEKNETAGVDAEYKWIKAHYEGYTVKGQSLNFKDKISYDIITITTADNKEVKLYFNISNYFGKF